MTRAILDTLRSRALAGTGVTPLAAHDPAAVAAATHAQEVGAALERWLSAQHRAAALAGIAHVRKVGPPVQHSGARGERLRVIGRGPADYQGVLRGGRALAVEAKSRPSRLSLREIEVHQQGDLNAVAELGGLALLVVELRDAQVIAAVPWREVPWHESRRTVRGRVEVSHTIGAEELAPWRVGTGCYLARWV